MNISKKIKNIIFDLGGVILNIDYQLTSKAFKASGISNFDEIYSQARQNNVFNDFETGEISTNEFRSYLKSFNSKLTDKEIDFAWNSMLLDLPAKRITFLKELKENYRIFLLSNTNEIHVKAFTKYIDKEFGQGLFENLFENHYYSNEIGHRKPNKSAFDYVLAKNGLQANETLFIDDSKQHVEGAKKAKINAALLNKDKEISTLFLDKSL